MEKTSKKLLAVFLCLGLVICLLSGIAYATLTEDIDVYDGTVWLVPLEGKINSCEDATIPEQYGEDNYPAATCLNITLTDVEDDASFTVSIRSDARKGNSFSRLTNYLSAVGFTYAERDDLLYDDDFYALIEESEASLYADEKVYEIPVQLENGAAWVILYYYTYSQRDFALDEEAFQPPIALVLNFHKESSTITEDIDIYDGTVWLVPPEGKINSCEDATIPEQYGEDNYPAATCLNITLTDVEDDASFTVSVRSDARKGNSFNRLTNYLSAVGFTYAERDDLLYDDDFYALIEESEASLYADEKIYEIPVQLENGAAWVVLYYYTYSQRDFALDEEAFQPPIALVLNFQTNGQGGENPPPGPPGIIEDDVLTKLVPSLGQLENENALYSVVPNSQYNSRYSTYLIVPNGYNSVSATLTFTGNDYTVTVNDIVQGPISENNELQVTLNAAPKLWTNELSDASVNKIKVSQNNNEKTYTVWVVNQRFDDLPEAVDDYICIGSQYTNGIGADDYGARPVRSLVGSNYDAGGLASGPVSLGNFGGYITYYYAAPITDNPKNPYGIDFITFGNSVEGSNEFGEVGQVWVSEDGNNWYALAGGMHYENFADWDYSITYTKQRDGGTAWTDSHNNNGETNYLYPLPELYPWHRFADGEEESVTLSGIYFDATGDTNEFGNVRPPFAGFGYTDMGKKGTRLQGETFAETEQITYNGGMTTRQTEEAFELLARNIAGNPYLPTQYDEKDRIFSNVTDGMDLAWAVDADGQPVDVSSMEFHYVKIVTASNINNAGIGEKSTEVNMVRVAQAADAPVGKTAAPEKITIDGAEVALEAGRNVYEVPVHELFDVAVTAPEGANIYINNNCAATASYDAIPAHRIIRVIVQEGEKEPWIAYFNLTESEAEPHPTGTLTLDANGGTVNGSPTCTYTYDESMFGEPLPDPVPADESLGFEGWFIGQKRYTAFPEQIGNVTLTARWTEPEPEPSGETISVTFRLIGSTLSEGDVDIANGDYKGAEYVTWIPTTPYEMDENATVADLFLLATEEAGVRSVGADKGYVSTVYAPDELGGYALSEFTNGPRSGWMYTMDGEHTNGINVQKMYDGAEIIFHYVNDYAWEVEDWSWLGGSGWPQLSTADNNYWNKWLEAEDVSPAKDEDEGGEEGGSQSGGESESESGTTPAASEPETTGLPFEDVAEDAWYYDAVVWAYENEITEGTGETTFSPTDDCMREQIVTFLWRAAGKPEPGISSVPFEDVKEGAYYYDAVLWAYEQGITLGAEETRFGVGEPCTREQVVTFLWRAAGKPEAAAKSSFSDVESGKYYAEAVAWAEAQGITLGVGGDLFGTGLTCTRAQIVTFLYRARETE